MFKFVVCSGGKTLNIDNTNDKTKVKTCYSRNQFSSRFVPLNCNIILPLTNIRRSLLEARLCHLKEILVLHYTYNIMIGTEICLDNYEKQLFSIYFSLLTLF